MGGHWGLGSKRPEVSKMRKHRTALDSTVSIRPVVASQSFREGTPKMQAKPRDGDLSGSSAVDTESVPAF